MFLNGLKVPVLLGLLRFGFKLWELDVGGSNPSAPTIILRVQKTGPLAAKAAESIRLNACSGITVQDVARHVNSSRRLVEMRFLKAFGHTILDETRFRRRTRVCHLLRETNHQIRNRRAVRLFDRDLPGDAVQGDLWDDDA